MFGIEERAGDRAIGPRARRILVVEPHADIAVPRFDGVARIDIIDRRGQIVGRAELQDGLAADALAVDVVKIVGRSEEHTSELQSLKRNSYAVFCWKKKTRVRGHGRQYDAIEFSNS